MHSVCFKNLDQQANIIFKDIKAWNRFSQHSRCGYGRNLHAGEISHVINNSAAQFQEKSFAYYYIKKNQNKQKNQLSVLEDPARKTPKKAPSGGSNM